MISSEELDTDLVETNTEETDTDTEETDSGELHCVRRLSHQHPLTVINGVALLLL